MKEFILNKFLKLKQENDNTVIYVANKPFRHCKFLVLEIPISQVSSINDLNSIDEIAEELDNSMEFSNGLRSKVDSNSRFWAHCSNLQVWYENNYDTRLLHRNLAFPLLKALSDAGDHRAKEVFKNEILKRLESGFSNVVYYLIDEGYLEYLDYDNMIFGLLRFEDAETVLALNSLFKRELLWELEPATDLSLTRPYSFSIQNKSVIGLRMPGMDEFKFAEFPELLVNLKNLKYLDLSDNYINERNVPISVRDLSNLEELNLSGCSFTNFPKVICSIISLKKINLSFNRIHSISESIDFMKRLESLNLSSNLIVELPNSIGRLESLKMLNLSNNKLTYLPENIINLDSLVYLELHHNTLESLPQGIENMNSLKAISIGKEQLKRFPHDRLVSLRDHGIEIK